MTRDTALAMLPIIKAFAKGKTIEFNTGSRKRPHWVVVQSIDLYMPADYFRIAQKKCSSIAAF